METSWFSKPPMGVFGNPHRGFRPRASPMSLVRAHRPLPSLYACTLLVHESWSGAGLQRRLTQGLLQVRRCVVGSAFSVGCVLGWPPRGLDLDVGAIAGSTTRPVPGEPDRGMTADLAALTKHRSAPLHIGAYEPPRRWERVAHL